MGAGVDGHPTRSTLSAVAAREGLRLTENRESGAWQFHKKESHHDEP
jgi:hypothetical protein